MLKLLWLYLSAGILTLTRRGENITALIGTHGPDWHGKIIGAEVRLTPHPRVVILAERWSDPNDLRLYPVEARSATNSNVVFGEGERA